VLLLAVSAAIPARAEKYDKPDKYDDEDDGDKKLYKKMYGGKKLAKMMYSLGVTPEQIAAVRTTYADGTFVDTPYALMAAGGPEGYGKKGCDKKAAAALAAGAAVGPAVAGGIAVVAPAAVAGKYDKKLSKYEKRMKKYEMKMRKYGGKDERPMLSLVLKDGAVAAGPAMVMPAVAVVAKGDVKMAAKKVMMPYKGDAKLVAAAKTMPAALPAMLPAAMLPAAPGVAGVVVAPKLAAPMVVEMKDGSKMAKMAKSAQP